MNWNLKVVEDLYKNGKINGYIVFGAGGKPEVTKGKKSKYGNKKVEIDGIVFDSKHEYHVFQGLKVREMTGEISNLRLQVPYELNEGGTHSLKYVADFVYFDHILGKEVVADAKGSLTKVYKKKRALMKSVHKIEILEIYKKRRK